jgi:hypothetical protein
MNSSLGFSTFTPSTPSYTQHNDSFQANINRIAAANGLVKATSLDMSMRQYFIHPRTKGVYYVEIDPFATTQTPVFMVTNSEEILRLNGY